MKRITGLASFVLATYTVLFGVNLSAQNSPAPTALPATAPPPASSAQVQDQSLGDFARKMHSKDPNAAAKPKSKVFDNENLPTTDSISVVGPSTEAANTSSDAVPHSDASPQPATTKEAAKASSDDAKRQQEWKGWQDKVASQKQQMDLATRELDVLQREYQLRAAEVYADAGNRLRNSGQWDKQDSDYKQKIADKQKTIDDAKQKLDDMQEAARKSGVPASMLEQQPQQSQQ